MVGDSADTEHMEVEAAEGGEGLGAGAGGGQAGAGASEAAGPAGEAAGAAPPGTVLQAGA